MSKPGHTTYMTPALWYDGSMESDLKIDVATLDTPHRRALEEVIGRQLAGNQRLIISVIDLPVPSSCDPRPRQTLEDWTHVYDGLSDEDIEEIDKVAKTRANPARNIP